MKKQVKAISRRLSRLPFFGRFVHIAAAIYHLPRLRAQLENTLPRIEARDEGWLHRYSALADGNTRISQRVVAVEQSAIGLLTGIMSQLGTLKADLITLTGSSTTSIARIDTVERTTAERLTQLASELAASSGSLSGELEAFRMELAGISNALPELRQAIDGARSTAVQQVAEVVFQLHTLKSEVERLASTLTELQHGIAAGNEAVQRFDALASSIGNVIRSIPIVLRELRREQSRLQAILGDGPANFALEPAPPSQALDVLVEISERRATQTTDALSGVIESLSQRMETLVGTQAATQEQVLRFTDTLTFLVGRIEFVRREVMFEMRYGKRKGAIGSPEDQLKVTPQIVATDKVAEARYEGLRLNLGCGHVPLAGYINVDRRQLPGVDVVAEVEDLPFEQGDAVEIMSSHVLEHFPQEQLVRELLPYWFDLLREGGEFRAIVPDAQAMIEQYSKGAYTYDDMREVIYGGQDYLGDFHYNMFTPQSLEKLLTDAGFQQVRVEESGRRNGKCYEFEIRAVKGP